MVSFFSYSQAKISNGAYSLWWIAVTPDPKVNFSHCSLSHLQAHRTIGESSFIYVLYVPGQEGFRVTTWFFCVCSSAGVCSVVQTSCSIIDLLMDMKSHFFFALSTRNFACFSWTSNSLCFDYNCASTICMSYRNVAAVVDHLPRLNCPL